jgi:16S rRNA (adenine1518-N6/adenine1519-N6)-dimethyltransferase
MSYVFEDPRRVLKRHGLAPKRSFSQNFLISERAIEGIAKACKITEGKRIVELGPGCGTLTMALAARGAHVVAVERDPDMLRVLEAERGDLSIEPVPGDAKEVDLKRFLDEQHTRITVAGNLPYAITGAIFRNLVEQNEVVERAVLMVQREVRDRLVAQPDTSEYGALTVFTTQVFRVETVLHLPRTAFHPPPNVTSSVVMLTPNVPSRSERSETFDRIVRASFQARRKTLRNALLRDFPKQEVDRMFETTGIDGMRRGETLSVEEFAELARVADLRPEG